MKRDLFKEERSVRKIIRYCYPENAVGEIKALKNGFKYPVWRVRLKESNNSMIVKIITNKNQLDKRAMEQNCYKEILRKFTDFPIPKNTVFHRANEDIKYDFVIEDEIKGKDLCFAIDEIENREEFIRKLAQIIGKINSIKYDHCGYFDEKFDLKDNDLWHNIMNNIFNKYIDTIEEKKHLEYRLIKKIRDYWYDKQKHLLILDKPSLVHNDITDRNIKVREDLKGNFYIAGIFDFELCMRGDPIKELSKVQWILRKFQKEKQFFYDEYDKYVRLPINYNKKIEMYCLLDRLKHFYLKDYLIKFDEWKEFLLEGEEEIRKITNY